VWQDGVDGVIARKPAGPPAEGPASGPYGCAPGPGEGAAPRPLLERVAEVRRGLSPRTGCPPGRLSRVLVAVVAGGSPDWSRATNPHTPHPQPRRVSDRPPERAPAARGAIRPATTATSARDSRLV